MALEYVEACFLNADDVPGSIDFPAEYVVDGLNSTYLYKVIELLLHYGLQPNTIIGDNNIMNVMSEIDNGYIAADTTALLCEHGGNPNLSVCSETVFESADFDVFFGAIEQYCRPRFDRWVHRWMVLIGYGGHVGDGPTAKTFRVYNSYRMFDLGDLRNHRNYYFGFSFEDGSPILHIYDKKTLWEVTQA